MCSIFDFAGAEPVTGDRQTTNVPVQALYLMNSPCRHAPAWPNGSPDADDAQPHPASVTCFAASRKTTF